LPLAATSNQRLGVSRLEPLTEDKRKLSAALGREELAEQALGRRRGEFDLTAEAEQNHPSTIVLIHAVERGQRRAQQPTRLARKPDPREMRLQEIEEEPVAFGEVAAAAAATEEKRLRVPERRRNRHHQLVLDVLRREPGVVDPGSVQLALGQEVGEFEGADFSLLLV
jgi:hypothetical protein